MNGVKDNGGNGGNGGQDDTQDGGSMAIKIKWLVANGDSDPMTMFMANTMKMELIMTMLMANAMTNNVGQDLN